MKIIRTTKLVEGRDYAEITATFDDRNQLEGLTVVASYAGTSRHWIFSAERTARHFAEKELIDRAATYLKDGDVDKLFAALRDGVDSYGPGCNTLGLKVFPDFCRIQTNNPDRRHCGCGIGQCAKGLIL